jgi:TRAP-type mannitol/chloroaromatic compound transport system substrate-binding protein
VLGRYDYANPAALKRLLSGGAQLRAFPQDVMEACYKAANEIYADLSKTNPMFKKMLDSLVPFRSDSYLWTQVPRWCACARGVEYPHMPRVIPARRRGG